MKTSATTIVLAGILAIDAFAGDRLIDTKLPKIGKDWIRRNDHGATGGYSWVNFDNGNKPGEVLSFVAWTVPPTVGVTNGPVTQASTEMFLCDGSARFSKSVRGRPIRDTVRHQVISIQIGTGDVKHDIDAIEYTYVYEGDNDSTVNMAHGYCFVVGETAVFVQHTSPKVISSELAFEMAGGLLSQHFGKPHSVFKDTKLRNNH